MAFKMRSSKFRHVFGKEFKKDQCYDGIKISKISADAKFCTVNPKFLAVMCEAGGGGSFLVIPLSKVGRVGRDMPLVSGHSAAVMDIKWCPHDDNIIASASEDCTIKLWKIPDEGLVESLTEDVATLRDHQKRVNIIEFHPTAKFILLSCGLDNKINIWNCTTATVIRSYDIPDQCFSVSFNYDGTRFATTLKTKVVQVYNPYEEGMIKEFHVHDGSKPSMCAYAKNDQIITTGFSKMSERQYAVYDLNKEKITCREDIDNSNGVLQIEYDYDTGLIFLWAKGDSIIRFYEITDEAPYMHYLSLYQAKESQKGMGCMPKRGLNVISCEINRFYKLWNNGYCEVIPFTVPRKSELFQEDLYPDTASIEAALTAEEFEGGKTSYPRSMSLKSGHVCENKEPVAKKPSLLDNKPKTKLSQITSSEPAQVKSTPPPAQKATVVEKATSNGSSEPPKLPKATAPAPAPAKTGPALPAGFDAEKMMKDIIDLKTIIKKQDKKIELLEKRVVDLEDTSEEIEAEADNEDKESYEDAQE